MRKAYHSAIVTVNGILLLFFAWLSWLGHGHLPGQLGGEMQSDVMLMKYQIVCARLTSYLTASCLLVIALVNIVLLRACLAAKQDAPSTANSDT